MASKDTDMTKYFEDLASEMRADVAARQAAEKTGGTVKEVTRAGAARKVKQPPKRKARLTPQSRLSIENELLRDVNRKLKLKLKCQQSGYRKQLEGLQQAVNGLAAAVAQRFQQDESDESK